MLTFRPFRNTDPPVLVDLWRSRAGQWGLVQPVSVDLFEQIVFSRLYFDYDGLIIARDDDRPVGFAHAGFGPNESETEIATAMGATCVVVLRPGSAETDIADALVDHCERYLRRRGATVLYGGGVRPLNSFYTGLYGGTDLPGVLDWEKALREVYAGRGYREVDRTVILGRELAGFETPIDRRQMQIRRQMLTELSVDPPARTWWEACTLGEFELTRFDVVPRGGATSAAHAVFRSMLPLGSTGVNREIGLVELEVDRELQRRGLATFLLSEALRQFARQGIVRVETQTMQHNLAALGLYHKLGFRQLSGGGVFRKS